MGEYDQLAARAREKDVNAFAMLYKLVYEDLYHMAFYMLGNAHDAEDVVSDTVLAAYEGIHKLKSAAAFKGWIFKILLNKCRRQRKAYANRPVSIESGTEGQEYPADRLPETMAAALSGEADGRCAAKSGISREAALDVQQAFFQLSETERTILAMSLFGGYKSHEIGKHLHMNANTVRTKCSRALGKLQDMLIERQGDFR